VVLADEQSCVIVRNNLQKECACVPFVLSSNAGATVTVNTHDATPVVGVLYHFVIARHRNEAARALERIAKRLAWFDRLRDGR
jgi:hypothetical protein